MGKEEDIWYAANVTRVLLAPRQTLETFGTTTVRYHLVSELMDVVDQVRVRAGRIYSERPQIITPSGYGNDLLEGFGEKAREYAEFLRAHGDMVRILKYGLRFRKDDAHEELVHEPVTTVANRIRSRVEADGDPLTAVIVGADELWEVSLLKFLVDYIQRSAPTNIQELTARQRERDNRGSVHQEIESEFIAAAQNPGRIDQLGRKLQRLGLFETYEDRFYALMRGNG